MEVQAQSEDIAFTWEDNDVSETHIGHNEYTTNYLFFILEL